MVNTTKVLIERFHLSGHTFRFGWMVQDLEVFLTWSNSSLQVKEFKRSDVLLLRGSQSLLSQTRNIDHLYCHIQGFPDCHWFGGFLLFLFLCFFSLIAGILPLKSMKY